MKKLSIQSVCRRFTGAGFGNAVDALGPVDFDIANGEFVAIVGPSGCGKSTLLKLIAGLDRSDDGQVLLDGVVVTGPNPHCGMVFQQFALFPWLTIRRNVAFGVAGSRSSQHIVDALLDAVGLAA